MMLTTFAICQQGGRDHNDDTFADVDLMAGRALVVADGAGGHRGGAVAARTATDAVLLHLASAAQWSDQALREAVERAGAAVHRAQVENRTLKDMSSTIVVVCLEAFTGTARYAHLGDSRALHFRRGLSRQLTTDHSVVQSFIDAGLANPVDGAGVDRSVLYAAIGAEGDTKPVVRALDGLEDGDAFLLCTDGVWDTVPQKEIERLLGSAGSVQEWVESIADAVRRAGRRNQDNFTALGAWLGSPAEITVIKV